jgi:type II secretory pathway pseudopilin PulG
MTAATRCKASRRDGGFTYLGLLITILLMTSAAAAVGSVWELGNRREKEVELLFIGDQFRKALAGYYRDGTSEADRYPKQLSDLVKDPRNLATRRYLRKIYRDPITGTTDWGLIRNASGGLIGGIVGVYSKSEREPLKQANFALVDEGFAGKKKYSEWVFMNTAQVTAAGQAANPAQSQTGAAQAGTNPAAGQALPAQR